MATKTKRDIVIKISDKTGITQTKVQTVLQETIDHISECLCNGEQVVFRNFGTFFCKLNKAKIGRNPNKPSEDIVIPERMVVKFKPGKKLKSNVANSK